MFTLWVNGFLLPLIFVKIGSSTHVFPSDKIFEGVMIDDPQLEQIGEDFLLAITKIWLKWFVTIYALYPSGVQVRVQKRFYEW